MEKAAPAPSRASRLIIRNLPFDITEQDLRAVFLPYGPIYSIHIPMKELEPKEEGSSEPSKPSGKGYAFVWMLSKKDAEKALEGANGKKVHSGMADGLVRDKQKKKKVRREEAKLKQKEQERKARQKGEANKNGGTADEGGEDEDEGDDAASDNEKEATDRVIAVDWALSKDKWEEAKAKLISEVAADDATSDDDDAEASSDSGGEDDSHIGLHDNSDGSSGSDIDSDDDEMDVDEESQLAKPQLPPPETGTTLFVRNVPFEATEDELRTLCVSIYFVFFRINSTNPLKQLPCIWTSKVCSNNVGL